MKIYLVQHGDSLGKDADPQQSLSPKGISDVTNLGHFLAHNKISIVHLYHSGKRRAEQSAEILASSLTFSKPIELHQGINPLDDINPIADEINRLQDDIMLVGHMPFIDKLIGKLIVLDENKSLAAFVPGTIACLERTDERKWLINWIRRPD